MAPVVCAHSIQQSRTEFGMVDATDLVVFPNKSKVPVRWFACLLAENAQTSFSSFTKFTDVKKHCVNFWRDTYSKIKKAFAEFFDRILVMRQQSVAVASGNHCWKISQSLQKWKSSQRARLLQTVKTSKDRFARIPGETSTVYRITSDVTRIQPIIDSFPHTFEASVYGFDRSNQQMKLRWRQHVNHRGR